MCKIVLFSYLDSGDTAKKSPQFSCIDYISKNFTDKYVEVWEANLTLSGTWHCEEGALNSCFDINLLLCSRARYVAALQFFHLWHAHSKTSI